MTTQTTWQNLLLTVAIVGMLLFPGLVQALTLKTSAAGPSVSGEQLKAQLRVAASGVRQKPSHPLDPVSGSVGETFEMGSLDSIPDQRVELRVELPWGQYYRKVSRDELKKGTVKLTVYPQGDNSNLEISRHGILVQPFPNRLMSREYLVLKNNSQSMAGGEKNPIRFELPEKMDRLIPGPGMGDASEMRSADGAYEYTNLIPPGESVIGFFYMIRPESSAFTFDRSVSLPTGQFAVRVPSYDKLSISTDGLEKAQTRSRKDKKSSQHKPQIYRASNLQPGDSIRITLEGLDKVSPPGAMQGQSGGGSKSPSDDRAGSRPSSFSNVSWPLILGIGFSVIIFVASYGYVQYKLAATPAGGFDEEFLIREIANLDQEFDDGAIDEAFYKRTRRRWKQKAEEVSDDEQA